MGITNKAKQTKLTRGLGRYFVIGSQLDRHLPRSLHKRLMCLAKFFTFPVDLLLQVDYCMNSTPSLWSYWQASLNLVTSVILESELWHFLQESDKNVKWAWSCNIALMVHKPKLAEENILWELLVRSQFHHIYPSQFLLLASQSGLHEQAFLALTNLTGISNPRCPLPRPEACLGSGLSGWDTLCGCCCVQSSAFSEQTLWVAPSPNSSPHLAWISSPSPALLGRPWVVLSASAAPAPAALLEQPHCCYLVYGLFNHFTVQTYVSKSGICYRIHRISVH